MNQPNFYGADFGFDSNSSTTLTLKFDECEAITESSALMSAGIASSAGEYNAGEEALDAYNNTQEEAAAAEQNAMLDSLRDNPVLTTASMPIPTRNSQINQSACRLPLDDFNVEFDLSQDLSMPQILLMDGTDLGNDDSSPTLFGLSNHSSHNNNSNFSCGGAPSSSSSSTEHTTRPIDVASSRGNSNDFVMQTSQNQPIQQQQNTHGTHHNLLATVSAGHQMWGSDANGMLSNSNSSGHIVVAKSEPLILDDFAIYQVDKADLIQGHHFNDDPLLDISIDDISLLEDNHSLQTLHNAMISPANSCTISPSGYGAGGNSNSNHQNYYNMQQIQQQSPNNTQQQHHNNNNIQNLQQNQPQHHHHHHHQQLQQLSPHQMMQPNQNLPIHSPPESVSLYETLNRSPYNLNTIVSPPTPTNSLTSQGMFQSSPSTTTVNGLCSPRARPISITPGTASSQMAIRKYKTNTAHQHTKRSALHDLLRKDNNGGGDGSAAALGQSVPGGSGFGGQAHAAAVAHRRRLAQYHHMQNSRLSSSAPTQLGMDQLWQRREPRPHLLSTSSVAEAESTSSLSTGEVLSPEGQDFSQDETYSDDSDHYEDFSSDDDDSDGEGKLGKSVGSEEGGGGGSRRMSKSERYFWQYNVQAKGPKGQRLVIKTEMEDPHVLNEVTDPVFSPNCSVRGIKHSGKARKGDGNDLTPNPRKLNAIGRELDKLFRVINDITPVAELPFNARTKTRKEKNKLASRACRLKKKAQHEANKIKLYGLEVEHKRLISGIAELKSIITALTNSPSREGQEDVVQRIERIYQSASKVKIGGMSTEYVNQMIQKVKGAGLPNM